MSDDEELLYGLLGTQFNTDADEQTEFKRSKLKRKAVEEEVVDAKGRATRFHGAFTGGFSAGYYNTVGSKEGFQPTDFVSQGKTSARNYRLTKPEDFMDDEDFNENGIAPRLLRTKSIFDNEDIRSHMKQSLGTHEIVGDSDLLKDILVPQSVTIGLMLLHKLGYLASRGVGEKPSISSDMNGDDLSTSKKFDYESEETFQLLPKNDRFGLGYSGMNRDLLCAKEDTESRAVNFGHRGKKGIRGVAFGGVDDEDDGDDLRDIYGHDSMSKYNYEYIEEDNDTDFGWTAPKHLKNSILPSDSIPGFQMGAKCTKTSLTNYEPLQPPRFYLPIYPIRKEKENVEVKKRAERPKLMPNEDIGSVFSLLSSDDRNRLLNAGKSKETKSRSSRWGDCKVPSTEQKNDINDNLTSIRNESNQRFSTSFKLEPKRGVAKSWGMVSSLSAKFKSAGSSTATEDHEYHTKTDSKSKDESELSTKELAANADTYGFMTRTSFEWHPDKLLCKRFNVPDPYPGNKFVGIPDDTNVAEVTQRSFNEYHAKRSIEAEHSKEESKNEQEPMSNNSVNVAEEELADPPSVEIKVTVPDITDKPPIDLFKAVFEDSDAEFSSSDDETEVPNTKSEVPKIDAPASILSVMEQALGAMFGEIPQQKVTEPKPPTTILPPPKENPRIYGPTPPPDFVYNPVIPDMSNRVINDIISKNIPRNAQVSERDPEPYVYIEKQKSKKKKHEKKSKKFKTHKKDKSKKKHKKKKSSSSSESSD